MIITVCIGSSCHLKGSRKIVERFTELLKEHQLEEKVSLNGSFCMGDCEKGVCVKVDGELHSVTLEDADAFFNEQVLAKL